MAESYEFTRLSDVESVEEVKDTDSVLIVQDNKVKKTTKDNVGGAGGYIYAIAEEDIGQVAGTDGNTYATCSTNYDDLLKTLEAGGSAWVKANEDGVYMFMSIVMWEYFTNETSPIGSKCLMILSPQGEPLILTNGTYVPNL